MSRPPDLAVLLRVTLHAIARAQTPPASSPSPTYHDLLARLKARDTLVDFTALRVAYAASPDYAPYGSDADDHRAALRVALGKRDYQRALQEADATLGIEYLDVRTHVVRAHVAEQLGDTAAALWDRIVAARLVRSIMQSGAGFDISLPKAYMDRLFQGKP